MDVEFSHWPDRCDYSPAHFWRRTIHGAAIPSVAPKPKPCPPFSHLPHLLLPFLSFGPLRSFPFSPSLSPSSLIYVRCLLVHPCFASSGYVLLSFSRSFLNPQRTRSQGSSSVAHLVRACLFS